MLKCGPQPGSAPAGILLCFDVYALPRSAQPCRKPFSDELEEEADKIILHVPEWYCYNSLCLKLSKCYTLLCNLLFFAHILIQTLFCNIMCPKYFPVSFPFLCSFSQRWSQMCSAFSQLPEQQMTQEMSWYSIHEKKNTLCWAEQRSSHPGADPHAR